MSNPFVRIWPALKDVDLVPVPAKLQQSGSGSGQNFLGPKIYHRGNRTSGRFCIQDTLSSRARLAECVARAKVFLHTMGGWAWGSRHGF